MLDVVVESIMDASDEELAEDVRATGDDPSEVAQRMKGIVDAVMAKRDLLFDRCRACGFDEEQSRAMVDTAYRRLQASSETPAEEMQDVLEEAFDDSRRKYTEQALASYVASNADVAKQLEDGIQADVEMRAHLKGEPVYPDFSDVVKQLEDGDKP